MCIVYLYRLLVRISSTWIRASAYRSRPYSYNPFYKRSASAPPIHILAERILYLRTHISNYSAYVPFQDQAQFNHCRHRHAHPLRQFLRSCLGHFSLIYNRSPNTFRNSTHTFENITFSTNFLILLLAHKPSCMRSTESGLNLGKGCRWLFMIHAHPALQHHHPPRRRSTSTFVTLPSTFLLFFHNGVHNIRPQT